MFVALKSNNYLCKGIYPSINIGILKFIQIFVAHCLVYRMVVSFKGFHHDDTTQVLRALRILRRNGSNEKTVH